MSTAKEKKYAKRMRNQPSSVSLSDFGSGQGGRPPSNGGRGSFHPHRDSRPGTSGGQQQRFQGQSPGTCFQATEGKGRGGPPDAHLVPKYITATMFAQARAAEINAMAKAVSQKTSNCLVFQSLPRHMRRRAMGYDIKRLPRRLREIAKKEMDKSVHQKKEQSKSKCRKARRRHGNLQMAFNRRQRKNIWLETHIWHTKRFHMLKKWGYCLPDRPTMKSYRTCYRAMTSNCLLQDLSYLCCLELIGEEEELLKSLSRLCSTDTGPSFAAAQCLSGRRQGSLVLYKADKYPEEALAPVTFIWKPNCAPVQPSSKRQLWIWTHPAFKKDILKELQNVFCCEEMADNAVCKPEPAQVLQREEKQAVVESPGKKRKRQDKDGEKAVPVKKIVGDGTRDSIDPYQWTSKQASVTIRDLTMEIVRYRLVGPLSHCVLTEALRAAPLHKAAENPGPHSWWASYCTDPDNVHLHSRQESLFQMLQGLEDPAQVPPGTILGLTLGDPRLNLPKKKTKAVPNLEKYEDRDQTKLLRSSGVPVECADSLIWSSEIRSKTTENKISEQEFNRLRGELLVPGSQLDLGDGESKIPVLLIQQPGKVTGTERPGWGSGWDICLPKGWGMAFWIPFIYRGVRVGGLQQSLQHSQFMAAPYVPGDFVDCPAGHQSAKDTEISLLEKYKRRPPAKRTNFIKHGILAPFRCPWDQLTREWEIRTMISTEPPAFEGQEVETKGTDIESSEMIHVAPTEDVKLEICSPPATNNESKDTADKEDREITYSVLRNKRTLRQLSVCCLPCRGRPRAHQPSKSTPQDLPDVINLVPRDVPRLLVWVRLSMLSKGSPELHAVICIPSSQDFLDLNNKSFPGPQEPKHSDTFKKKVLKCQKDKKKEKSKKKNDPSTTKDDLAENISGEQLSQRDELTFGLWPQPLPELSIHCNRHLIGFVTQGNFSMAAGCGEALGFVCVSGLTHMLSSQPADKKGFVLIRNPSSLQYRFAKLFIDV
ncbi:ribonucleases P/MRP protein subunit POP1 [Spea bombifrons]|uniref:ribonucleases P/MRP protein subunit POP1 n=1 Tax=Spea bombifrons TaxID=233779 RepID=UPI002349BCA4|nr:ribonucleases P/MRP protein subunit POP1 [Spea bombifrons]